jgi:hypothetical protein
MWYNNNCVLNPEQETSSCDASAESASECEQSSAKNSCSSTSSGEEEEVGPSSSSNSGEEQQQQRRRSTLCASSSKTLLLLSSSSSQATLLQQKQQRHVQPPPPAPLQHQTIRLRHPTSSTSRKQRPKSFTDASMTLLHQQKARNPSCFVGVSDTALNILSGVSGWSSSSSSSSGTSSGSASKVSSSVAGRRHAGRTKRSKPRLRSSTEDFPTTTNFVRSLSFAEEAQNNPTTFETFHEETSVKISTEEEILKVVEEVGGVVKPQFQILGPVSTGGSGGGALLSEENNSSVNTDALNGAEQDWDSYQVTNERPPGLGEALRGRVGAKVPSGRPLLGFFLEGTDHSHLDPLCCPVPKVTGAG